MKISFDLDGTFFSHPDLLGSIAVVLKKWGCEVGVLSSRNEPEIRGIFKDFPWDFIHGCSDNSFMHSDEDNAKWKSEQVQEQGIDIHFDDLADQILHYPVGTTKIIKVLP